MSFCGVQSKLCTPAQFGLFIGLKVSERPFDIAFKLFNEKELRNHSLSMNVTYHNKTTSLVSARKDLKPLDVKFHMCNESYQYGDIEYGAKCSCKACKSSCEINPSFMLRSKKVFKVGRMDGVVFIMILLFILFLIVFFFSLFFFGAGNGKDTKRPLNKNRRQAKSQRLFLLNCFKYLTVCLPSKMMRRKETLRANGTGQTFADSPTLSDTMPTSSPSAECDPTSTHIRKRDLIRKQLRQLNFLDRMRFVGEKLERLIEIKFNHLGRFCATYPKLVLFIGLAFCSLMCLGYFNFSIEKDPIKLWSADSSKARQNKKYFDEHFSPFYRITQLIIEPKIVAQADNQPIFNQTSRIKALRLDVLNETYHLYNRINQLIVECIECEEVDNKYVKVEDICFQPLSPDNKNCSTQSIFQYWQNDHDKIMSTLSENENENDEDALYLLELNECMRNPFQEKCFGSFGGPVQPYMIIGSYKNEEYVTAGSLVITYIINNYLNNNKEPIRKAMAWEAAVAAWR